MNSPQLTQRFHECIAMMPADRDAYLSQLETADPELAAELRQLVRTHEDDPGFLEESAADSLRGSEAAHLPDTIGGYRIVSVLGCGGMGTVYLGVRDRDQFVHEVAIKVIKRGMDTDQIIRRFLKERQITAQFKHENIARLLDGGSTVDGQPYFVLEHIQGLRIDAWAKQRALSAGAVVALFRKVCDAVSYAHRHLVIHRDLKPGNILVTADGVPKLLDFGIATWLADRDAEATAGGLPLATPEYASPEQLAGAAVTTASDIYSLGVVLRELLQSASGTPRADLAAVLGKALRDAPEARYASVEQFGEDLDRCLTGLPVLARPATVTYRVRKFVARHRIAVAAAVTALLSLTVTTGWALYQTRVARHESALAGQRFKDARELANSLLYDVYDQVAPLPGSTRVTENIARQGIHYLDNLSASAGNDLALRSDLASGYLRLALLQGHPQVANKGNVPAALASIAKAVRLQESVVSEQPRQIASRAFLATLLDNQATLLSVNSQAAAARSLHARCVQIAEQIESEQPTQQNRFFSAVMLLHASDTNREPGTMPLGLSQVERAVAITDQLAAEGFSSRDFQEQRAFAHKHLGALLSVTRRDYKSARTHYLTALKIDREVLDREPQNAELLYSLTFTESDLASIDASEGRYIQAKEGFLRVLATREKLLAADPSDERARFGAANTCQNLSSVFTDLASYPDAVSYARRALDLIGGPQHLPSGRLLLFSRASYRLGHAYLKWAAPSRDLARLQLASRSFAAARNGFDALRRQDGLSDADQRMFDQITGSLAEIQKLLTR